METIIRLSGLLKAGQVRSEVSWGEAYNPRCGDIWKLKDNRYVVVDYVDSFITGITFSDGERKGCRYTQAFGDWLRNQTAELISTFEKTPFPGSDNRGWTANINAPISNSQSVQFINDVISVQG